MSGLLGAMSMAMGALAVDQQEVENSANNVANSNTPGYARRRMVLQEDVNGGVSLGSVQSVRDPLLDAQVQQETQQQSASEAVVNSMQPVQTLFSSGNGGIADSMQSFFNSLQQLSTSPSDLSLRSAVLTSASNLASAFHNTASQLAGVQANLDLGVTQSVAQINQLTAQLASVNGQEATARNAGQSVNSLDDQRQNLLSQLSGLVNFSTTESSDGPTITTADGTPLVVGGKSFALSTSVDAASGFQHVISAQGADITTQIQGGQLGGILQARDVQTARILSDVNTLAASFAGAVNLVHSSGYDLNAQQGGALFTVTPGTGAAESMTVAITDPSQIAASSDTTAGGNGNVLAMIQVGQQNVVDSQTPTQYLSGVVFKVGNYVLQAQSESDAGSLMLQQLQDEQGAISGVSIDEEASNLISYQRAYQAAAQVVQAIDNLTLTAINLGVDTAQTA